MINKEGHHPSIVLLLLLLVLLADLLMILGDHYEECQSPQKQNNFTASFESCSRYIYCDGENSFAGECLDNNHFNEEAGSCVVPELADCKLGFQDDGASQTVVHEASSDVMQNGDSINNAIPNIIHYDGLRESSTEIFALSTTMINTFTSTPPRHSIEPPKLPARANNTLQCPLSTNYLPHPYLCSAYYICLTDIAIPMSCPGGYNFHAVWGRCEPHELVDCALNRSARLHCVKGVYDSMPHPDNCEYYYVCANGFLMVFQCPFDFKWHFERRSCVRKNLAKCYTQRTVAAFPSSISGPLPAIEKYHL